MGQIAYETRQLSFDDIKPKRLTKYIQILEVMQDDKLTAREIEERMCIKHYSTYFDLNHVRPRLTELVNEYGEVVEDTKKFDWTTQKNVTVYRKATADERMIFQNMQHIPVVDMNL